MPDDACTGQLRVLTSKFIHIIMIGKSLFFGDGGIGKNRYVTNKVDTQLLHTII